MVDHQLGVAKRGRGCLFSIGLAKLVGRRVLLANVKISCPNAVLMCISQNSCHDFFSVACRIMPAIQFIDILGGGQCFIMMS